MFLNFQIRTIYKFYNNLILSDFYIVDSLERRSCDYMEGLIWWLIAGTKGGINRARIINELNFRPYNINQIANNLNLDYKTVKHHMDVLIKNNIVESSGEEQYGTVYMLSTIMKENFDDFKRIWKELKTGEKRC